MGLSEDLRDGSIAVDACIFIYFLEKHSVYRPILRPLFEEVGTGERTLVTSALTLLEIGVGPLRNKHISLWRGYERFLRESSGIRLVPIVVPVLRSATIIRAQHKKVRTPDALQLASAMTTKCTVFLTNDKRIPSLPGLKVLQLSAYV